MKNNILNIIFAVICVPINLLLIFLGDAFIWAGIVIILVIMLVKYAPKRIWIALIIITIISIMGSMPRSLVKSEKNEILNYLNDKYDSNSFKIKRSSLSVKGSGKYCSGSWISICLGFKMFNWTNLNAVIADENGIEFNLEAIRIGHNKFEEFKDSYKEMKNRNDEIEFMNNRLIPILKEYSITDVKYDTYGWIEISIIKEHVDKEIEEQMWQEIINKLQYNINMDSDIIIVYYKNEPYWYNEIETFYLKNKEWKEK